MATWNDYLNIIETKGVGHAWKFAQANFDRKSLDYQCARRFSAPTVEDRMISRKRQLTIDNVTEYEMRLHCQLD